MAPAIATKAGPQNPRGTAPHKGADRSKAPAAVATIISVVPISPFVTMSVSPPNATAFARQAKKRKRIEATTFGWKPWTKSST